MNEKQNKLIIKLIDFFQNEEDISNHDIMTCLLFTMASTMVTVEKNHDGLLLENNIKFLKEAYGGFGNDFEVMKMLRKMGLAKKE